MVFARHRRSQIQLLQAHFSVQVPDMRTTGHSFRLKRTHVCSALLGFRGTSLLRPRSDT